MCIRRSPPPGWSRMNVGRPLPFVLAALLCLLAACSSLEPRPELPLEAALPVADSSTLDSVAGGLEAQHQGESGFRLVKEGAEAFAARVQSARLAQRSLDVQTYIWHTDLTGIYIAGQVLAAADRGVHVRLLLDDLDARDKNASLAAMAAHPNIEVRLFNPFASRSGTLSLIGEGVRSFERVNRRMHNKTWIADNRIAIAGGRNIGDEYFGASDEVNFVDLEFAMIGPVVRDASASFDRYWNSASAYPVETLDPQAVNQRALQKLREHMARYRAEAEQSRYAAGLRSGTLGHMAAGVLPLQWARSYQFVADDPDKVTMTSMDAEQSRVGTAVSAAIQAAQSRTNIISPYFVPGPAGTDRLVKAVAAGRPVLILTNSLAANDVAAVHGGYSAYRKQLLEGGVQIWELKPQGGRQASSMFGSSGASLHTKALVMDRHVLFVGSYNLDPRSTWLNCEQGVLVDNPVLAGELADQFATQIDGAYAWQVTLQDDELRWSDGTGTFDSEPKAGMGRRFQAWLGRVLGLESQL